MTDALIELSEYSTNWPRLFATEKEFLSDLIGSYSSGSIEHVGSTAVPGLISKPVIDIMFGVKSLSESKAAIDILRDNGYCYFPYKENVMHWFCKPSNEYRTHHLHLIPYQSPLWLERIKFRDILRSNPDIAKEYCELKIRLSTVYKNDREHYTNEKWPFIKQVLDSATYC